MNTIELIDLVKKDRILSKVFLGVFPSDKLPITNKIKPAALIINTDPSKKPGNHWVAVYFDSKGSVEYFDCFGDQPIMEKIRKFLIKHDINYVSNTKRLQSSITRVCGLYCLYYLYFKCRGIPMFSILDSFNENYDHNDVKLCSFMYKTFNFRHNVCSKQCNEQECVSYYSMYK